MSQDNTYLRDVFAGLALNGIIPTVKAQKSPNWNEIAVACYLIADCMMDARKAQEK